LLTSDKGIEAKTPPTVLLPNFYVRKGLKKIIDKLSTLASDRLKSSGESKTKIGT